VENLVLPCGKFDYIGPQPSRPNRPHPLFPFQPAV
jgi:hypothetical protein